MKKILSIATFLFYIGVSACECDVPKITEKYIQSDFVASITIIKVYPNKTNESGYKADIIIDELFKGEQLKSIYIYGRSDGLLGNSCDINIPENTKLIAYVRKNDVGNYGIGKCFGSININQHTANWVKTELEILRTFKSKGINYTEKTTYREKPELIISESLKQFNGIKLEKKFAIYEITFSSDLKIKTINIISGFENQIDEKLIEILWKTKWRSYNNPINDKVEENSKLLIGIYNYEGKNGNFLSQFNL